MLKISISLSPAKSIFGTILFSSELEKGIEQESRLGKKRLYRFRS